MIAKLTPITDHTSTSVPLKATCHTNSVSTACEHTVLTQFLTPKFEQVSSDPTPRKRIEGMKALLLELPEPPSGQVIVKYVIGVDGIPKDLEVR